MVGNRHRWHRLERHDLADQCATQGMPRFTDPNTDQLRAIWVYIRAGARKALDKRRADLPEAAAAHL